MEGQGNYSRLQLDALKEVSNIGAGNAATALSTLLNKKIDMTVPAVNIVEIEEVINSAGEEEVIGVIVRVLGDIQGNILIVLERKKAIEIAAKLTFTENNDLSELGISALCEIGNIVSGAYMNAIAQFTGMEILPTVPAVADDMLSAILSATFMESEQYDEFILDIETVFLDDSNNNLGAHFYYVPKPGSLEKILKALGMN